jgi:cell wall-associated NlpC family hydrolase
MPVSTGRTSLLPGLDLPVRRVSLARVQERRQAKHRKPTKTAAAAAPRAAAAMTLSVGLAVGATAMAPVSTAHATTAAQERGNADIVDRPLLRFGDSGTAVHYVQVNLRRAHLDVPVSNWYGSATRAAVADLQREIGLRPTGSVNWRTWNALYYIDRYGFPKPKTTTFNKRVLREAAKLKGTPYRYGGTTPRGFDCSGFTGYVYKHAGKKLPRTSRGQYRAVHHISRAAAKPGDLVFFKSSGGRVYHVGIYAGGNMIWHASKPGRPVAKAKIWSKRVAFGRR